MNISLPIPQILTLFALFLLGSLTVLQAQKSAMKGETQYQVVIDQNGQYAIWLADNDLPKSWKAVGIVGDQARCQSYIKEVWTDMRPLNIRQANLSPQTRYQVVVNHEEQYAIYPGQQALPKGWKAVGKSGNLQDCMNYIEEVWTDMRPLSLRRIEEKNR